MDNFAIVGRIKRLCRDKKISMTQFYKESGITSSAMSQWVTGRTSPKQTTLSMVAEYLGTTTEYLINGEKEQKEKTTQADGLTMEQKELIFLFQNLSPEQQEKVLAEVKSLLFG